MKSFRKAASVALAAVLCAGIAAVPAAGAAQRETEQFDRTIPFHAGGTLKLDNFSGRVTITATNGTDIVIHATRHATRERLDRIHIGVEVDSSQVSIEANRKDASWHEDNDNVVETDFDIQVPRQTNLDVKVFSSGIQVAGVSGREKLHTFSGEVRVTDATGPMDAETFSGDIDVAFAGSVDGEVDFDSFSGRLNSSRPVTLRTSSRRSRVHGEIGNGGGMQLRFKTFSGDVTLR